MGCLFIKSEDQQPERRFSMSEEDQVELKVRRINLYINNYNREIDRLEGNVKLCHKKALEYKGQQKKQMSLYFINKKKILQKEAKKFQQRSIFLTDRKSKIQDLEDQRQFGQIMKETNDLLENHINQNVIRELERVNQIENEIRQVDETLANQVYSPDVIEEFEKLDIYNNEFNEIKESISLATFGKRGDNNGNNVNNLNNMNNRGHQNNTKRNVYLN